MANVPLTNGKMHYAATCATKKEAIQTAKKLGRSTGKYKIKSVRLPKKQGFFESLFSGKKYTTKYVLYIS